MSLPAPLPIRLTDRAASELDAAFSWYEAQRPGLGAEFLTSIEAALAGVGQYPAMYPQVRGRVRRALTRRFPYGIFSRRRTRLWCSVSFTHGSTRASGRLASRDDGTGGAKDG